MRNLNNKIHAMFQSAQGEAIYKKALMTVKKHSMQNLIDGGVLVGFSGGADSVLLLSFLYEYKMRNNGKFTIACAHINHMIRGKEADRDAKFSYGFATALDISCNTFNINVPEIATSEGISTEEAGRNARYSAFDEILSSRNDVCSIAVAHNATDNVETVIFNMMRGAGLSGMCGIKPVRGNVVRPLIEIPKRDIISLLISHDIPYVQDSTNQSNEYTRNYIRNEILPSLERLNSDPEGSVTRMVDNLSSALAFIDEECEYELKSLDEKYIPVEKLRSMHPAVFSRVMYKLICDKCGTSPEEKHITRLSECITTDNFAISLPGKYDFVCQRGNCFFDDKTKKIDEKIIFQLKCGENIIHGTNLVVYVGEEDKISSNVYKISIQAKILSAIISEGLTLRLKADGDSYRYSGITHKLKKVFNDNNIPSTERNLIPVICDSEGIVFVPGLPVRDNAKGTQNDYVAITLCYKPEKEGTIELSDASRRKPKAISSKERL